MEFLTNKLGPLPAWAWGAVVGGTLLVASYFRRSSGPSPDAAVPADGAGVDANGNAYAAPASGAVLPWYDAGGAAVDAVGSGVDPDTLARLGAIEDQIANQPPAPTLEESLAETARLQDAARAVLGNPNAQPAPIAPPPPPPAPPAQPAPTPAPPAYLRTLGPWKADPGAPPAGYRKVRRGDGRYLFVDQRYHG